MSLGMDVTKFLELNGVRLEPYQIDILKALEKKPWEKSASKTNQREKLSLKSSGSFQKNVKAS